MVRARPQQAFLALGAAALVVACGGGTSSSGGSGSRSAVELRGAGDHPRLALVRRDGDPTFAVATAVGLDSGALASAWLARVVDARVEAAGGAVAPVAHGAGFVIRRRVRDAREAARVVAALSSALRARVTAAEIAALDGDPARAPALRRWNGAGDQAAGLCAAELGSSDALRTPTAAELETARSAAISVKSVAFAAVGPENVLDAAEDALEDTRVWPDGDALEDPWPRDDVMTVATAPSPSGQVSVALRVPDPARALESAVALSRDDGPLAVHAAALDPPFRVERVVAVTRPRGACLRIDLLPDAPELPLRTAAAAAGLAFDEAVLALGAAPGKSWTLGERVLESPDPAQAAAVAAWNALAGQLDPGPRRLFATHEARPGTNGDLRAAVSAVREARTKSTLDVETAVEAGQGELWALVASPCATATESASNAGAAALVVRALSREADQYAGVRVEPWITADGIGLYAHATRRSDAETEREQAERLGDALGRAFAAAPLRSQGAASVRADTANALAPEIEPLLPLALAALSPERPSLLYPLGTWQSVSEQPLHALEAERRALVRGPLRLAVLAPDSREAAGVVRAAAERWLTPERERQSVCGPAQVAQPRPGLYEVLLAKTGIPTSRAIVGVGFRPSTFGGFPVEAEWTAHALGRSGGLLERAVTVPGVALHAETHLLGGGAAAALIVEVATPGERAREAAEQVRALFTRLADGAATADDVTTAKAALASARTSALLDPRSRIAALWRGRAAQPPADLASLRRFHRQHFTADRHVVVVTKTRP